MLVRLAGWLVGTAEQLYLHANKRLRSLACLDETLSKVFPQNLGIRETAVGPMRAKRRVSFSIRSFRKVNMGDHDTHL